MAGDRGVSRKKRRTANRGSRRKKRRTAITNVSINLLNYHTNLFTTKFDLENEGISTHTNASYLFVY